MYLKEAFRYQNYLNEKINKTMSYLCQTQYVTKSKQEHMRKKANPEAEDETVDVVPTVPIEYNATQLIGFLEHLTNEKYKLTTAISAAKRNSEMDIDAEVANNRIRHKVAEVLARVGAIRPSERIFKASGYKFNAEGNQVPYSYDVKEITTIDFDRHKVKGLCKKVISEADEVSNTLDRIMVELKVDYEPEFSVNDSFEDAIERYIEEHENK